MSCLSIIQDACNTVGLGAPTTIETTSDPTATKMLGLLNRVGKTLVREYDWQALTKQASFTTNGASEYTISASPVSITDFAYLMTPFIYDRTDNRVIIGVGANEYQLRKMYGVGAVSNYRFRIIGNKLQFDEPVPTGHSLHFEYKTNNWVIPSAGSDKTAFTLNDDTTYLNEELLTLGLIWKYKNINGFAYDEEFRDYQMFLSKLKDQDKDQRLVDFGDKVIRKYNFPDTYDIP